MSPDTLCCQMHKAVVKGNLRIKGFSLIEPQMGSPVNSYELLQGIMSEKTKLIISAWSCNPETVVETVQAESQHQIETLKEILTAG